MPIRNTAVRATLVLLIAAPWKAGAQEPVVYEASFENRAHHEARITVTFPALDSLPLELRMSRSSPGRYALHEFAKNVYAVEVEGASGRSVTVTRPDPHGWTVSGHGGEVRVTYTLFANRADGTYSGIDRTHAHLNMPATFMWARGLEGRPIRITFQLPDGSDWRVATQLEATSEPHTFRAPDLAYFLDSPSELSDHDVREWTSESRGRTYTIRIVAHHIDRQEDLDRYQDMVRRIVEEQEAIFGELPDFDFGSYTFLADYLPWVSGDGMEHRNSTVLTSTSTIRTDVVGLVGTVAHEFFHAWNIERMRPRDLEPFDFDGANMSDALWFGEGFTSYYDDLTLRRAGIIDDAALAARLGGAVSTVLNSPGRRFFGPVGMSRLALFADRASFADPTSQANTFISYYTWGSVVGLALDLSLRSRAPGLTLDGYMRRVWETHGRPFLPYTVDDLERLLGDYVGDSGFARDFFARFVRGGEVPNLEALLSQAGILLRKASPGRASLGAVTLDFMGPGAEIVRSTILDSPLYRAGLDDGDRILAVDGRPFGSRRDMTMLLLQRKPGDVVTLTFESQGATRQVRVTLEEVRTLEAVLYEAAGREPTEEMLRFRRDWLSSRVP